eukprot:7750640-Alexandrium_andersonii.AAC.1
MCIRDRAFPAHRPSASRSALSGVALRRLSAAARHAAQIAERPRSSGEGRSSGTSQVGVSFSGGGPAAAAAAAPGPVGDGEAGLLV